MSSYITYDATRARIDDFLRQAAEQRIAKEARPRTDASPSRMLRQRQRRLGRVRRARRGRSQEINHGTASGVL